MLPLHRASSAASLAASDRAQKRWDLLRMHFLEYPVHSKALTRQKWHSLAESALDRSRELKHRRQVRALFFHKHTHHVCGCPQKDVTADLRLDASLIIGVASSGFVSHIPLQSCGKEVAWHDFNQGCTH